MEFSRIPVTEEPSLLCKGSAPGQTWERPCWGRGRGRRTRRDTLHKTTQWWRIYCPTSHCPDTNWTPGREKKKKSLTSLNHCLSNTRNSQHQKLTSSPVSGFTTLFWSKLNFPWSSLKTSQWDHKNNEEPDYIITYCNSKLATTSPEQTVSHFHDPEAHGGQPVPRTRGLSTWWTNPEGIKKKNNTQMCRRMKNIKIVWI